MFDPIGFVGFAFSNSDLRPLKRRFFLKFYIYTQDGLMIFQLECYHIQILLGKALCVRTTAV